MESIVTSIVITYFIFKVIDAIHAKFRKKEVENNE